MRFLTSTVATAAVLAGFTAVPALAAPTAAAPAPAFTGLASPIAVELAAKLPEMRKVAADVQARLGLEEDPVRERILDVIDPTDYECSTATPPVVAAITADFASLTLDQKLASAYVLLFDLVMKDAVYFPQPAGKSTYGAQGTYTKQATDTFAGLRKFWDIKSNDIQLVPAHGRMLLDTARVTRVFTTLYGQPLDLSENTANFIKAQVTSTPLLKNGDFPAYTFNAYAFSTEGEPVPGIGNVPDKIVMGDGVLDGFGLVGLGDVTPQAILAHEFGHHIQYEDGLFDSTLPAPEATRRTELMADSFSAYFLTHVRGERMNFKRVQLFTAMFAQIGDCGFDAPGHHGTPNQRVRAALWGYGVSQAMWPRSLVLPSRVFAWLFEKQLPLLVAPDAPSDSAVLAAARQAAATVS
ncbi:hypothetical protein GCM10009741_41180 [Kribbella lupini]|uniref:Uncharacterized protein n=2 Tax=Kribbella lupini TaxID=291602 RepID=A0ABP4M069_9ACTN